MLPWNQKLNHMLGLDHNRFGYFNYLSGVKWVVFLLWRSYLFDAAKNVFKGAILIITLGSYWVGTGFVPDKKMRLADTWWGLYILVEGLSVLLSLGIFRISFTKISIDIFNWLCSLGTKYRKQ